MPRAAKATFVVTVFLILVPIAAHAQQGQIAGTARDAQGAVMPGVLVEVTSPALIEKVRSATTGAAGQYRITNLPVGTYSVTFTLEGFTKQQRDNVVLTTGFTAPVNADDGRRPAVRDGHGDGAKHRRLTCRTRVRSRPSRARTFAICRRRATSAAS